VIAGETGAGVRSLTRIPDFYSLSGRRYLAFNVQEPQL